MREGIGSKPVQRTGRFWGVTFGSIFLIAMLAFLIYLARYESRHPEALVTYQGKVQQAYWDTVEDTVQFSSGESYVRAYTLSRVKGIVMATPYICFNYRKEGYGGDLAHCADGAPVPANANQLEVWNTRNHPK